MKRNLLWTLLLLLPVSGFSQSADSLRVLWIGNSYTFFNDMPSTAREIASTQGVKLSCTRFLTGGERFSGHLTNRDLLDAIAAGGWDFVVLQEQSSIPALNTAQVARDVYPFAYRLDSLVHASSPDAKVVFYMTWGHKNGTVRPTPEYPLTQYYREMQERLKTSYLEMTYDNNAWCAPVGMAWQQVRAERPDIELYHPDTFHPSAEGSYLAACVIFATISGKPFTTSVNAGLPPEIAAYLQQTAQTAVFENAALCNIVR